MKIGNHVYAVLATILFTLALPDLLPAIQSQDDNEDVGLVVWWVKNLVYYFLWHRKKTGTVYAGKQRYRTVIGVYIKTAHNGTIGWSSQERQWEANSFYHILRLKSLWGSYG